MRPTRAQLRAPGRHGSPDRPGTLAVLLGRSHTLRLTVRRTSPPRPAGGALFAARPDRRSELGTGTGTT